MIREALIAELRRDFKLPYLRAALTDVITYACNHANRPWWAHRASYRLDPTDEQLDEFLRTCTSGQFQLLREITETIEEDDKKFVRH